MRTLHALICLGTLSMACGGEPLTVPSGSNTSGRLSTASKIMAYLDGKTLTMSGAAIPSHPNGYDQDTNFASATQCYKSVTMRPQAGRIEVVSLLGSVENAPNTGDHGACNHDAESAQLTFESTAVLIENIRDNGGCFDFTVTYPGFGQEGRGSIDADGTTLVLELFFKDQAIGHRCADGDVGARTVTLNQNVFMGDAQQTYAITE